MLEKLSRLMGRLMGESTGFETPLKSSIEPLFDLARLHHHLPYESYDEQTGLFHNKESTGFVLRGIPLVGAALEDQTQIANFFSQKNYFPEGASLQFLLFASPKIEESLQDWESVRQGDVFKQLAKKRVDFFREQVPGNEKGIIRNYELFISYTVPKRIATITEREQILMVRKELKATLDQIGLPTKDMSAEDLLEHLTPILNFHSTSQKEPTQWDPNSSLSNQLLDSDTYYEVDSDKLVKDGKTAVKTWFPKVKPKEWALPYMEHLLGDIMVPGQQVPCSFLLHYGFMVCGDQAKRKAKAFGKRDTLEKNLKTGFAKWQPRLREEYEEASDLVLELQNEQRFITAATSLTVFCEKERLPAVEQALHQIWSGSGWYFVPAIYDHLPAFLSNLPMTWVQAGSKKNLITQKRDVDGFGKGLEATTRAKATITREAQNMLPIIGEWKGQITPGMLLHGRRGQLFYWSPQDGMLLPGKEFHSSTSSYNVCISGTMGSGKSFLCNEMITTTLGVGGKAFVLDKGESFKNLCYLLGGHHLDFSVNTKLSLNPFTHIPEGETPEEREAQADQLYSIEQIVKTMAFPYEASTSLQDSYIKKAVLEAWESKKSKANIDIIHQWLMKHEDSRARDIGQMLWPYSQSGIYGKFFNKPATVDLNHDLVVIETQNLKADLRAVIVQIMIVQVWQRMVRSSRGEPFLILIDEAWEMIQGASSGAFMAKFIEAVARTARKYRASLVLATQNLTDYFRPESPGAQVAFENAAWKCILHQSSEVTTAMKDHPHLKEFVSSSYKEKLIRSLQQARYYSEFVLFGQNVRGIVGQLRCDPFTCLLYSTKPQDFMDIQHFKDQGLDIGAAIEAVLACRQKGLSAKSVQLHRKAGDPS